MPDINKPVSELSRQVAEQCRVVAHLGRAVADTYEGMEACFRSGDADAIAEQVGRRTAAFMETLGDMLNATDAVTDDDDWTEPVFKEAQRWWPAASTKA